MSNNEQLKSIKLDGIIYGSTINPSNQLILDIRDIEKQSTSYFELDLSSLRAEQLHVSNTDWWTKLVSADSEWLYLLKYKDRNDPNSQVNLKISLKSKNNDPTEVERIPSIVSQVVYPFLYESGTEYHKMVSDFLGLELPLSCEYLEWNDKIIISYYLRSDNEFDRYLLLLDNGKKEWKLHQDHKMKGFSSESFFIHNDQLIFFKELNEVCIYNF